MSLKEKQELIRAFCAPINGRDCRDCPIRDLCDEEGDDSPGYDGCDWCEETCDKALNIINGTTSIDTEKLTGQARVENSCKAQPFCSSCPLDEICCAEGSVPSLGQKLSKEGQVRAIEILNNFEEEKKMKPEKNDPVNPNHYKSRSGIECIQALTAATEGLEGIEAVCTANAIKYLWRWKEKNGTEDLKKAVWYINHLISVKEEMACE